MPIARPHVRLALTLLIAAGLAACNTWQARPDVLATALPMRRQVRLWVGGRPHQVHAVLVQGDSVYAVDFIQPPRCDSCVHVFPLAAVDSVQVRAFNADKTVAVFIVLILPTIGAIYIASQIPST